MMINFVMPRESWLPCLEWIAGLVSLIYTEGSLSLEGLRHLFQLKTDYEPACAGYNLSPAHYRVSFYSWYS